MLIFAYIHINNFNTDCQNFDFFYQVIILLKALDVMYHNFCTQIPISFLSYPNLIKKCVSIEKKPYPSDHINFVLYTLIIILVLLKMSIRYLNESNQSL